MWPLTRKRTYERESVPMVLPFKDGAAFLEYQCKLGMTDLVAGRGVVALVLDARKEIGAEEAVQLQDDGSQSVLIRVASDDGGFVILTLAPNTSALLAPGDVVIWVPMVYSREIAEGLGDVRKGWAGLIRAKLAPELDLAAESFRILHEF